MIDGERLWPRISDLGEIGKQGARGVTPLSFTEEVRAAKDQVASFMQETGLSVREAAAEHLFGRREGRNPDSPAVLSSGSRHRERSDRHLRDRPGDHHRPTLPFLPGAAADTNIGIVALVVNFVVSFATGGLAVRREQSA